VISSLKVCYGWQEEDQHRNEVDCKGGVLTKCMIQEKPAAIMFYKSKRSGQLLTLNDFTGRAPDLGIQNGYLQQSPKSVFRSVFRSHRAKLTDLSLEPPSHPYGSDRRRQDEPWLQTIFVDADSHRVSEMPLQGRASATHFFSRILTLSPHRAPSSSAPDHTENRNVSSLTSASSSSGQGLPCSS
jgi:hypothetical protein